MFNELKLTFNCSTLKKGFMRIHDTCKNQFKFDRLRDFEKIIH
jgi:hypothetical protein